MFCPSCGASCPPRSIACTSCGAVLPGLTSAVSAAPAAKEREAAYTPYETVTANETPGRNKNAHSVSASSEHKRPSPRASHASPTPGKVEVGRVKLVVEQGRILGEQFLLNDHKIMIGRYDAASGRCPDIDLTAQDPAYVHREHVKLSFNRPGDQLMMYDMGGRNGSYLNNQLIEKNGSALVQLGDKIRVGRVVMRLQQAPEVDNDGA